MSSYFVIIDDERTFRTSHFPPDIAVVYLRTSQDALEWFAKYVVEYNYSRAEHINHIWFDHDLGKKSHDDGIVVARFIASITAVHPQVFWGTRFLIHTQNPVGARNIQSAFLLTDVTPLIVPLPDLEI